VSQDFSALETNTELSNVHPLSESLTYFVSKPTPTLQVYASIYVHPLLLSGIPVIASYPTKILSTLLYKYRVSGIPPIRY